MEDFTIAVLDNSANFLPLALWGKKEEKEKGKYMKKFEK